MSTSIATRNTSKHKEKTLEDRLDLARRFLDRFPLDSEAFDEADLDRLGVELGNLAAVPDGVKRNSAEWRNRLIERHNFKAEINLGGKCSRLGDDQFQLVKRGKKWRVIRLRDHIGGRVNDVPDLVAKRLLSLRREIEQKVNAKGEVAEWESKRDQGYIDGIDDLLALNQTMGPRYIARAARDSRQITQVQGDLPALLPGKLDAASLL